MEVVAARGKVLIIRCVVDLRARGYRGRKRVWRNGRRRGLKIP